MATARGVRTLAGRRNPARAHTFSQCRERIAIFPSESEPRAVALAANSAPFVRRERIRAAPVETFSVVKRLKIARARTSDSATTQSESEQQQQQHVDELHPADR